MFLRKNKKLTVFNDYMSFLPNAVPAQDEDTRQRSCTRSKTISWKNTGTLSSHLLI